MSDRSSPDPAASTGTVVEDPDQTPSLLPTMNDLPSHKVKKYDRQLRLWGDHGQAALERSRICLLGATVTGAEVLKNLILPGIGSFCIVDSEVVKPVDLGTNFFVNAQGLGSPRAEVMTRLLLEMNPEVKGEHVVEALESVIQYRSVWLQSFSVVIAADILSEKLLLQLDRLLWTARVPLIICRVYGMVAHVRIVCKEHLVTEAHPDNFVDDLRLEEPFPELAALASSCHMDDVKLLTNEQHSHVPFVIVMLKCLEKWRKLNGSLPVSFKEKSRFRDFVRQQQRLNEHGVQIQEQNFDEAAKAAVKLLGAGKVSSGVQKLFDDPACININSQSAKFWIIVHAIKDFVQEGSGHLPLSGALPDMVSDTKSFVALQTAYRAKAGQDMQAVIGRVRQICDYIGASKDFIKPEEVKYYCRNAAFLQCIRTSNLCEEYEEKTTISSVLQGTSDEDPVFRCSMWYVMLRSLDSFYLDVLRLPGSDDKLMDEDVHQLRMHANKFLKSVHAQGEFMAVLTDEMLESYCREVVRWGGGQVHSVAGFIGGVVGQEVIKLISGQYIPLNNTLIYDAAASVTSTFTL